MVLQQGTLDIRSERRPLWRASTDLSKQSLHSVLDIGILLQHFVRIQDMKYFSYRLAGTMTPSDDMRLMSVLLMFWLTMEEIRAMALPS